MTTPAKAIDALDAVFQQRRSQVPVLARRAAEAGITAIRSREEVVPLLFPHTTYKSYPEALVTRGQWVQMNRWLDSLSTYRVEGVQVSEGDDVDGWIAALHAAGHLVSSSSGTSGKGSFLNKTRQDREVSLQNLLDCLAQTGLPPERAWRVLAVGPDTGISHHNAVRDLIIDRYCRPDAVPAVAGPPSEGHHRYMSRMAEMRRTMADGTARPDDVAAFEAEATARQTATRKRLESFADQVQARPEERFFFTATFPLLFQMCELLRERGVSPGDITGDNAMTTGGGLKGMALPADYKEQIFSLLNIAPSRFLHYYSMQELNVRLPKCAKNRYHVPSELELFVLEKDGEALAEASDGQVEGRAAFFDHTVDGRWGGTISGDKILVDLGSCPCGRAGATVFDEITRYSDLADGDKITCAGTMDAYVRGFIED